MIMPTLSFLLYLLAIGGAWLLKMSYLGWFGPYFLLCVIVLPLFLALLSLPSALRLRLSLHAASGILRGAPEKLALSFSGAQLLPLCRLRIRLEIENRYTGERFSYRYDHRLMDGEELLAELPTALCGQLVCRVTRLECRDLLGLFAIRKRTPDALRCTVLPAAVPPDPTPDLDAALERSPVFKPKYGGGYSEEHELREYRPGDTINSIHWKLSSKTDSVIVREALVQENSEVYLVLSRVGAEDRGLEILRWLSDALCRREVPHVLVADAFYTVEDESRSVEALSSLLSVPMGEPVRFDASRARCVFRVSAGEVFIQ